MSNCLSIDLAVLLSISQLWLPFIFNITSWMLSGFKMFNVITFSCQVILLIRSHFVLLLPLSSLMIYMPGLGQTTNHRSPWVSLSLICKLSKLGQAEKKQKRKKVRSRDQSLPAGGKRNCGSRRTMIKKKRLKLNEYDICRL